MRTKEGKTRKLMNKKESSTSNGMITYHELETPNFKQ